MRCCSCQLSCNFFLRGRGMSRRRADTFLVFNDPSRATVWSQHRGLGLPY
jgi:hypothetical protein